MVHWVREYRVDGFRMDLMGHMPLRCIKKCRAALDALTVAQDGIDGPTILLYGEGWEFGEIAGSQRGVAAVQQQLAGSGVGSFNDRVRDAALGGSPFADPRVQGFATGLFLRPWPDSAGVDQGDAGRPRAGGKCHQLSQSAWFALLCTVCSNKHSSKRSACAVQRNCIRSRDPGVPGLIPGGSWMARGESHVGVVRSRKMRQADRTRHEITRHEAPKRSVLGPTPAVVHLQRFACDRVTAN